jgi:hypothetical protein
MASDLPDMDFDQQDVAEVFDEDNTNLETDLYSGRENPETLDEIPDVYDATRAVGDSDDEAGLIGEEMDDEEIVALERASDQDDADLEDDDLVARDAEEFDVEEDLQDVGDVGAEDFDDTDAIAARGPDEVELEYAGDLNDLEGAEASAADLESARLSDSDLRELDYKDEYTIDDDDDGTASAAPDDSRQEGAR